MKKICYLLLVMAVSSCAFPSTKSGMTLTNYESSKQIKDKVFVKESTGGSTTLPFWTSEISDKNFTDAVKDSLLNSKTFSGLAANWDDSWGLKIEIFNVDQPLLGIDFTVLTNIKYTLYLKNKKVYETMIRADGTATINDSIFGVARLRLANEKSAQVNIKKFIEDVSKQNFIK